MTELGPGNSMDPQRKTSWLGVKSQWVFEHLIQIVTSQQNGDTNAREGRVIEMDTINPLKVKWESFSTFNKNIFSFEALEVLSHIFFFTPFPAHHPSKMS